MNAKTPFDIVIINGDVVLADTTERMEVGIRNGKIERIGVFLERQGARVIDAAGQVVMAGMIDVHVHLNEPGMGHWEGFASGSDALAAGGCTTYFDMPLNGIPPTVTVSALRQKRQRAMGVSLIDYGFWGGLMPGHLEDLPLLAEAGVIGFKAFMSAPGDQDERAFRRVDDDCLYEGMKRIAELDKVLVLHAESESLVVSLTNQARLSGQTSAQAYVGTRPVEAEVAAVEQALDYAKRTGCKLHFAHISSEAAVQRIVLARQGGMSVTLETCPHYLLLTEEDLLLQGGVAKCAPPLRSRAEQEKLWHAVRQGHVDMIASDHSPCPGELKQSENMFEVWGGIAGAQHSLELLVDEGYLKRGIPLQHISRLLSETPAKRFGLWPTKGEIREGADSDLVLISLKEGYTVSEEMLYHRHKHSPYIGRRIGCKVKATIARGRIVYDDQNGIARNRLGVECLISREF